MSRAGNTTRLKQHSNILQLVCLASVLIVGLMGTVIGLEAPLLNGARKAEYFEELPLRTALVLKKLTIEQKVACDFVTRVFEGSTDTERQKSLVMAQQDTLAEVNELLLHYSEIFAGQEVDYLASPSVVFPYAALTDVQSASLKRTLTPGQISARYQLAKQRAIQLLVGAASRMSSPRHSASISAITMANLLYAESVERILVTTTLRHSHLTEELLSQMLEVENLLQYQCAMYLGITKGDAMIGELVQAMQDGSRSTVKILTEFVTFPQEWTSYIKQAEVTSADIAEALPQVLQVFLDRQEHIMRNTNGPSAEFAVSIGLASVVVVLVLVAVLISLRRLCLSTLAKEVEAEQSIFMDALGRSHSRIMAFLESTIRLDVGNIQGTEGKSVHATEREIYSLEPHIKRVLRLVHPAIPRWRSLLSISDRTGPVPRELVAIPSSILMIDLSAYQFRPTGETIKSFPGLIGSLLQGIISVVESVGGALHEVSATRVIVGWNLTVSNSDHEMSACHAVRGIMRLRGEESGDLRYAVATGQVVAGVSGSASYKPFVLMGKPVVMATHLLRVAQIHGVLAVVDTTTFSSLDSQQFSTRPLEVIAFGENNSSTELVTAHELLGGEGSIDRDRLILWNKAFDALAGRNFESCISLLKQYRRQYGFDKSALRLASLAIQKKPCTSIADLNDYLL